MFDGLHPPKAKTKQSIDKIVNKQLKKLLRLFIKIPRLKIFYIFIIAFTFYEVNVLKD